ncbi:ATP-binding cassette domain-containing protein [Oceanobacillus sp. J11TS1]|uniref:ATP-binding cassette domain-containing protein n=1 Tax=Oceanobacillus sp. J11TS1 TaxID=2807191 RepID=UPI001B05B44E|nr:ATP-binding cassette domain-containing protein [Oceanobacillus sp. J11TS1]GIO22091.1 ABC transporter ATP-binding protein [Oceanobacillus sp. J11TS1]
MNIYVEGLCKAFKKKSVLSDVHLSFSGVYGLLGPNGAGKTTLMKILAGLESFQSGIVYMDEQVISTKSYVKKIDAIGYLSQDFMVYPELTVYQVLEHIAVLQGKKVTETAEKIHDVLKKVNLQHQEKKKMKELSGGMRRRVGIAQLLLREPSVLLFDEPTAGLDIEERVRFRNLLKKLGKHHLVIISSHLVEDIEFLCNRIGIIKDGNVLFEGKPQELKEKANEQVYQLEIRPEELDDVIGKQEVIQMEDNGSRILVRFLSDEPIGEVVSPRLIDGYLTILKASYIHE